MVNVLIVTELLDIHSLAVAHVLQLKGHKAVIRYGSDFPTQQQGSINIEPSECLSCELTGPDINLSADHFDVVLYRRAPLPVLPTDMHPGDRKFAERECRAFLSSFWRSIAPEAFWVNPFDRREYADCKPVQLREALSVGLQVPPTLCSNDPEKIRSFFRRHGNDVVYKPFWPVLWEKSDDSIALLLTSAMRLEDLPDDETLRLSPGIFQPRLEKAYELRVTYMGGYQVAVKIFSQEKESFKLDWRSVFTSTEKDLKIEEVPLPPEIEQACRSLMHKLGLVFGCFDFIVTTRGEYIFLEVNEMGQFMWIEEMNPDIRLLEPFVEFLMHRSSEFSWKASPNRLYLCDFIKEVGGRHLRDDVPLHVRGTLQHAVND